MQGTLFLVSMPIGNYEDITLRALKILKQVDFVICEEFKIGKKFLDYYKIEKELFTLNEHNEAESSDEIASLLSKGKSAALISDAGTPLFSDPGHILVSKCIANEIEIKPVPGANSLLSALIVSGLDFEKFYFYGWLSPKKEKRRRELNSLRTRRELIVLMETPYRLERILEETVKTFGGNTKGVLAYKLTMPEEKVFRGSLKSLLEEAKRKKLKGEFVLLIDNRGL
jgi:16S rRNA (cytidine1402-2'-O)-methyltransferase